MASECAGFEGVTTESVGGEIVKKLLRFNEQRIMIYSPGQTEPISGTTIGNMILQI